MTPLYINTSILIIISIASFIWAKISDEKSKKKYDPFLYEIWGWMDIFWQISISVISGAFGMIGLIIIIYEHLK